MKLLRASSGRFDLLDYQSSHAMTNQHDARLRKNSKRRCQIYGTSISNLIGSDARVILYLAKE